MRMEVYPSLQGHERQYKLGDLPTETDFFQSCGWEAQDQGAGWVWEKDLEFCFLHACLCVCTYVCLSVHMHVEAKRQPRLLLRSRVVLCRLSLAWSLPTRLG